MLAKSVAVVWRSSTESRVKTVNMYFSHAEGEALPEREVQLVLSTRRTWEGALDTKAQPPSSNTAYMAAATPIAEDVRDANGVRGPAEKSVSLFYVSRFCVQFSMTGSSNHNLPRASTVEIDYHQLQLT